MSEDCATDAQTIVSGVVFAPVGQLNPGNPVVGVDRPQFTASGVNSARGLSAYFVVESLVTPFRVRLYP
jgi:hypothetical protein